MNMGGHPVFVLLAYLALLQWEVNQSAPVEPPSTNAQLRVPLNCMDWFSLYCCPMPYCSFITNKRENGNNRRVLPNDVKITIPTATKRGRTNIIIENRHIDNRLPKEIPKYNCKPQINDKTKLNVIVELKCKGCEKGSSENYISNKSAAESSVTNIIESHDKEVAVSENVGKFDGNNNDRNANGIESQNKSTSNNILENSNIAIVSNNNTVTTADDASTTTKFHDATVGESSVVIGSDDTIRLGGDDIAEAELTSGATSTNFVAATESSSSVTDDYYTTGQEISMATTSGDNDGETESGKTEASSEATSEENTALAAVNTNSVNIAIVNDDIAVTDISGVGGSVSSTEDNGIDVTVGTSSSTTVADSDSDIVPEYSIATSKDISRITEPSSEVTSEDDAVNTNYINIVTDNDDNTATDINSIGGSVSSSEDTGIDVTVGTSSSTTDSDSGSATATEYSTAIDMGISGKIEPSTDIASEDDAAYTNSFHIVKDNYDDTATDINGSGGSVSSSSDLGIDITVGTSSSTTDVDNDSAIATEYTTAISKGISGITQPSSEATSDDDIVNTNSVSIVTDNGDNTATDINSIGGSVSSSRDLGIDVTVSTSSSTTDADSDSAISTEYSTVINKGISGITEPNSDATSEDDAVNTKSVDMVIGNDDTVTTDINGAGGSVSSSEDVGIDVTIGTSPSTTDLDNGRAIATEYSTAIDMGISGKTEPGSDTTSEDDAAYTNSVHIVKDNDDDTATDINGIGGSVSSSSNLGLYVTVGTSSSTTDVDNDSGIATEYTTAISKGISGITEPSSEATSEDNIVNTNSVNIVTDNGDNTATDINGIGGSVSSSRDLGIDVTVSTSSSTSSTGSESAISTEYSTAINKGISGKTEPSSDTTSEDDAAYINSVHIIKDNDDDTATDINGIGGSVSSSSDLGIDVTVGTSSSTTDVDNDSAIATNYNTAISEGILGTTDPSSEATSKDDALNTVSVTVMTGDVTSSAFNTGNDNSGSNESESFKTTSTTGSTDLSGDIKPAFEDEKSKMTSSGVVELDSLSTMTGNDEANTGDHLAAETTHGDDANLSKGNVAEVKFTSEMISSNGDIQLGPDSDKAHQVFWSKFKGSSINGTADAVTRNNPTDTTDTTDKENKSYSANNETINDISSTVIKSSTAMVTEKSEPAAAINSNDDSGVYDDKNYT